MSLIPSSAISSSLTPLQRATNDHIQARRVQSAKNFHHAEEVDELDETAVNSVRDEKQEGGQETQFSVSRTERGSRQHRAGPLAGGQPMDVVGITTV